MGLDCGPLEEQRPGVRQLDVMRRDGLTELRLEALGGYGVELSVQWSVHVRPRDDYAVRVPMLSVVAVDP